MKKFAIIGCGNISGRHAENIVRVGKLTAVCDIIPERADNMAAAYQAKAYYSIDELLAGEKEIDIISVCTPNGLHAEHIIKSLQADKDVLTEKPLCLTKAAAWQIIETEKLCRRKLYVVKSARYNPILKELKKLLGKNGLGKLYSFHLNCIWNRPDKYYTDWKGKVFPDGGTLYNQFSHYIDVMLWLFGEVKEAKGFMTNAAHQSSIEFEDTGAASLLMENEMIGSVHWSVNAFQKNHEIGLSITAENGTIKIGGEYLNEVQYVNTSSPVSFSSFSKESLQSHKLLYEHLAEAQVNDENIFPGAFDGLRTVETIEKIYKACS
jgi:UDP-N-acetyl-2-amino-2-deoxyglucuronate dehydrogenase